MTSNSNSPNDKSQVTAAFIAMTRAGSNVRDGGGNGGAVEAAQEAALLDFPEAVREEVRAKLRSLLHGQEVGPARSLSSKHLSRPSLIPPHLPATRPHLEVPAFPAAGLDDPEVREVWAKAHLEIAEARFMLQPKVLRAYAEAQLSAERWDADQRGRKPSGDRRRPVPRDRLEAILREMNSEHERTIERARTDVDSIASGDVVGVEVCDNFEFRVLTLVRKSDLAREAAKTEVLKTRTPEQVAADEAAWELMIEETIAEDVLTGELQRRTPEANLWALPELPMDREPTASEAWEFVRAVEAQVDYQITGEKIEEKRRKDAETKVRTQAKREAEQANPEAAAASKEEMRLKKAADRQRRFRERQKAQKAKDKSP